MRTTMDKQKLLAILRTNRETHLSDFEQAWKGFIVTVIEDTEKLLQTAKEGGSPPNDRWQLSWSKPESHVSDYDRAIGMVEHNVSDTLDLGDQDFSQFVLDEWQWKMHFAATTEMYAGKFAR